MNKYRLEEATGILVSAGDAAGLAVAFFMLLTNTAWRQRLGENAAIDAQRRFDLKRQVDDYRTWYWQIIERWPNYNVVPRT